jgi:AcrR family transcriptional regulator
MARKRNALQNEAMVLEIKTVARRLMAEEGTHGLSIRGIAKVLDISPPAIYHYFPSLDDLITALIVDGFNALADALEAAQAQSAAPTAAGQLFDVLLAYRQWAVEHSVDFQLIYGNPIPGYVAPREVTVPAVVRTFVVIIGLIEQALQAGELSLPSHVIIPSALETHYQSLIERDNYPISTTAFHIAMLGWTRIHGAIMLELFNHFQATVGDAAVFYEAQIRHLLREFGMKSAA